MLNLAITLLLAVAFAACGGEKQAATWTGANPEEQSRGPDAPTPKEEVPLERIRDEGSPGKRTVMFPASGLRAREYVLCAGPRSKCENDSRLREPYEHRALELTKDGQSALFRLAGRSFLVTEASETSVYAMDNPRGAQDASRTPRFRRLRIDGTEVPLEMVSGPVQSRTPPDDWSLTPSVPGAGVVLIDFSERISPGGVQIHILVDERPRALRQVDLPRNGPNPGLFAGRYWRSNPHEVPWLVYRNCGVEWVAGDILPRRLLGCAEAGQFARRHSGGRGLERLRARRLVS